MISNLRISVAELVVWALLAAAGLTWISFRVVDGAAWLVDWLRNRSSEDDDRIDPDDPYDACPECGSWTQCEHDRERLGLPPERTWEEMTSHQLPVVQPSRIIGPEVWVTDAWSETRERLAPWWEAGWRGIYQDLGLDYPSGLLARVRELTP